MTGEWKGTISVKGQKNYLTDSFRRPPLKAVNFSGKDGEMYRLFILKLSRIV